MKITVLVTIAMLQPVTAKPTAPAALPLTEVHRRDLSCVATLAIVASEQGRGMTDALAYPLLAERGKTYAGLVGERIINETGETREQIRTEIINAVAAQQAKVKDVAEPGEVVEAEMAKCLPLLDQEVPPKPKPTLNQCAAMLEIAYREVYGREGLSKTAQDLKTLSAVLDNRAREQLRAQGYSGNESDILLTTLREKMLAEARVKESAGESSDLDYEHCFTLAAPKDKVKKSDH